MADNLTHGKGKIEKKGYGTIGKAICLLTAILLMTAFLTSCTKRPRYYGGHGGHHYFQSGTWGDRNGDR